MVAPVQMLSSRRSPVAAWLRGVNLAPVEAHPRIRVFRDPVMVVFPPFIIPLRAERSAADRKAAQGVESRRCLRQVKDVAGGIVMRCSTRGI